MNLEILPEQLRSKIAVAEHEVLPTPCWLWTAGTSGNGKGGGYGRVWWDGKVRATHHVTCALAGKPLPDPSLQHDHLCERRGCCNPAHIEFVPNVTNSQRRAARARSRGGLSAWSFERSSKR